MTMPWSEGIKNGEYQLGTQAHTLEGRYADAGIKVVSLSGYAQSGKDTAAKFLVEEQGFVRIAFADALREGLLILDPYILMPAGSSYRLSTLIDIMGWDTAKTSFPEIRRLLQVFGQEVGRDFIYDSIWIDKAVSKIASANTNYVVTDTRYPNEFGRLRDLGATMVWISRPGVGPINNHASESSITSYHFDVRIENNGTLDELKEQVLELV